VKHILTLESIFTFLESQSIRIDNVRRHQIHTYLSLVIAWSGRVNLVSRRDLRVLPERHLLPCLWLARQMDVPPGAVILDLGTGAGLPGILIQVLFADSRVVLLDAIRKKTVFLQEVCRHLMLPATVVCERMESYSLQNKVKFDYVVCRAVSTIDHLWTWSRQVLKPGGYLLAMKGGACANEFSWLRQNKIRFQQLLPPLSWAAFSPSFKDKHIVKIVR
jgi:16S rRNA (guanine527-N7)-methyltransferase